MSVEPPAAGSVVQRFVRALMLWFDTSRRSTFASGEATFTAADERVDWARILPFVGMHLACLAVFWVGVSAVAVAVALALYWIRMFAITGFYHRYFSHRAFKTSRVGQFIFGVLGASAVQRGPIWWAAHHRHHHAHSDKEDDAHSPIAHSFVRSHMSWFLSKKGFTPDLRRVRDLMQFKELLWLDRFDILIPVALAVGVFGLGAWLETAAPQLGTDRWQMLVWARTRSTRSRMCSANSATAPATRAATTSGSLCSRSAKAGTTITTTTRAPRARGFTGGRSTSRTTYSSSCRCSASSGI
jgi:Fatty acid desaturase